LSDVTIPAKGNHVCRDSFRLTRQRVVTVKYSKTVTPSTDELTLIAIIAADVAVIDARRRAADDDGFIPSTVRLGKPRSTETRAKIGAARVGKPRSAETRAKISATRRAHSASKSQLAAIEYLTGCAPGPNRRAKHG
jgi:hypothetical protein